MFLLHLSPFRTLNLLNACWIIETAMFNVFHIIYYCLLLLNVLNIFYIRRAAIFSLTTYNFSYIKAYYYALIF
jgi:hypothetical protein